MLRSFACIFHNCQSKEYITDIKDTVAARKKIEDERCECVFDAHTSKANTSKASKELKVVLHLWRVNVKTTGEFVYISLEHFHKDKTAP